MRDINHSIKMAGIIIKRTISQKISPELISLYISGTDFCNAMLRSMLSSGEALFILLARLCGQWKKKCYRKGQKQFIIYGNYEGKTEELAACDSLSEARLLILKCKEAYPLWHITSNTGL